jgi:hypothetical protein
MKTFKQHLSEATRQYIPKLVDPALMTFAEYKKIVNPSSKYHPEAYDMSVDQMNSDRGVSYHKKDWPKLINQFKVHGLEFEVRESATDRWESNYCKVGADGELVRDESGMVMYMDRDEVAAMFPGAERYRYEHAIFDVSNGKMVANTQDEWNCLLVMVAREYRKFGLGTKLVKIHRDVYPTRDSGGMTQGGYANIQRVHALHVREYLSSGMYSHLVKSGQLTAEKVKEIVASIGDTGKNKNHVQMDLDVSDTSKWLLIADASRAILYHQGFYDYDHDGDESGYWSERFILGYATIGGSNNPFIFRLYGASDRIKSFMLEVMLNTELGDKIALDPEERKLLDRLGDKLNVQEYPRSPRPKANEMQCWLDTPTMNWQAMVMHEKRVRKQFDKYDEYLNRLEEMAHGMAQPE